MTKAKEESIFEVLHALIASGCNIYRDPLVQDPLKPIVTFVRHVASGRCWYHSDTDVALRRAIEAMRQTKDIPPRPGRRGRSDATV